MQMSYILSGCLASSATPLTISWRIFIFAMIGVCLRYVDDKKHSVFQSNAKYLNSKIFKFWFYGL